MKNELIKITNNKNNTKESIDKTLSFLLLNRTLGQIIMYATTAANVRTNAICTLIFNAIFGTKQNLVQGKGKKSVCCPDINLINEVIKRIDGAAPEKEERDKYANLIGDALERALDGDTLTIFVSDLAIDAMAKAILQVAMQEDIKMSPQQRRERQTATDI